MYFIFSFAGEFLSTVILFNFIFYLFINLVFS